MARMLLSGAAWHMAVGRTRIVIAISDWPFAMRLAACGHHVWGAGVVVNPDSWSEICDGDGVKGKATRFQ
jgi:hypothetical protein